MAFGIATARGLAQLTSIFAQTRAFTVVTGISVERSTSGTMTFTVLASGCGMTTSPRQPHGPPSPPASPASGAPASFATQDDVAHALERRERPAARDAVGGRVALVTARIEQQRARRRSRSQGQGREGQPCTSVVRGSQRGCRIPPYRRQGDITGQNGAAQPLSPLSSVGTEQVTSNDKVAGSSPAGGAS